MRRWAFNPPRRDTPMPEDIEAGLRWLAHSSAPVAVLQEASSVTKALDACGRKLDGSAAAPGLLLASSADLLRGPEVRGA